MKAKGMFFMRPGVGSLVIIGIVALLIFGPSKLPELGKALGSTLKEFKKAAQGLSNENDTEKKEEQ